ncbi:MAG: cytochrome C [Hydrogenophilales bacterium CG17_big_fil_post_rev_8_21_14_2_50_63_12]|nr:MAG: cytochrome C [Hydrogenophilales bacterium CG17_big_fil_post_rev_8_21_14_2_50_63_12]PIX96637.1 MAG: cytochrome C [Hydrogenophilales bacterium CG_4_10_14_3_um_filter_63_21]
MKRKIALFVIAAAFPFGAPQADPLTLLDDAIGLSKTSVFDDPAPAEFAYSTLDPKKSGVLPRAYEDAPPQIPHRVDKFFPITVKLNKCMECHDDPDAIGHKKQGKPTAMPESHYVQGGGEPKMANGRHFCSLCHVPQAGVDVLVGNNFDAGR